MKAAVEGLRDTARRRWAVTAALAQGGADTALRSWIAWIIALLLSLLTLYLVGRAIRGPASYPDFIVGAMAWGADGKLGDYARLFTFIGTFAATMAGLMVLAGLLQQRIGDHAWDAFEQAAVLCCVPALLWLGTALFVPSYNALLLLFLSPALLSALLLLTVATGMRGRAFWPADTDLADILTCALAAMILSGFSVLGFGTVAARLLQLTGRSVAFPAWWGLVAAVVTLIVFIAALSSARHAANATRLVRQLEWLRWIAQAGLPLLFLAVVPLSWSDPAAATAPAYAVSALGFAVPILLAAAGWVALARRATALRQGRGGSLSIWSLIAILVFLKTQTIGAPSVPADDYHFGEDLVPLWSYVRFGLIPFVDMDPARGLANYGPQLASWLFLDGTAAAMSVAKNYWHMLVLIVAFPIVRWVIGLPAALFAFVLMPVAGSLSVIDITIAACLALLCHGFLRWPPIAWLFAALLASILAVLVGTGQGGLLAVAVTPLALLALTRALRDAPRATIISGAAVFAILGAATYLSNFGSMLLGAIRYGLEQSTVNTVANALPWSYSYGLTPGPNSWLWEALRASWVLLAGIAAVVILRAAIGGAGWTNERQRHALAFAVPIFLLTTLFVLRAAGRIDPISGSRLLIASAWTWCLIAPLLLHAWWAQRRTSMALLVLTFIPAALVVPHMTRLDVADLIRRGVRPITPAAVTDGAAIALPNLGTGVVEAAHLTRLHKTKTILDQALAPSETYVDLTNRGAQYFYFARRPPIASTAAYNLISSGQQQRAVAALRRDPPPLALIAADSIQHDGGSAALRAYLLYRYLMLNYTPAIAKAAPDQIWMIERSRRERIDATVLSPPNSHEDSLALLDRAFRLDSLKAIPSAWGQSSGTLLRATDLVARLDDLPQMHGVTRGAAGVFTVNGEAPVLVYTASAAWSGRSAGLMTFDFACRDPTRSAGEVEIRWSSNDGAFDERNLARFQARRGSHIVPLDAMPRWLLADTINAIRISVGTCRRFTLSNVALRQRHAVKVADP